MTTEIQKLSDKLAQLYNVDNYEIICDPMGIEHNFYLAEDSGRISALADDAEVSIEFFDGYVKARKGSYSYGVELFEDHPTKQDAARWARVRCLLVIGEKIHG